MALRKSKPGGKCKYKPILSQKSQQSRSNLISVPKSVVYKASDNCAENMNTHHLTIVLSPERITFLKTCNRGCLKMIYFL